MNKELLVYLKETKYCNKNNPAIIKLAEEITRIHKSSKDKAVSLFYWVRDNIPYALGSWSKKSSQVLRDRQGMCTNKTVLLVSLLRAVDIPAGFGVLEVKGQEYLGPIATGMFTGRINKRSVHFYTYVFLNNKWIKIDPSVDKQLSQKTSYFNFTTKLEEWDGENDALLYLDNRHIIKDLGPLANVDNRLDKKPRNAKGSLIKVGNIYLEFLRNLKQRNIKINELELVFKKYLFKYHFISFCIYFLASFYKKMEK